MAGHRALPRLTRTTRGLSAGRHQPVEPSRPSWAWRDSQRQRDAVLADLELVAEVGVDVEALDSYLPPQIADLPGKGQAIMAVDLLSTPPGHATAAGSIALPHVPGTHRTLGSPAGYGAKFLA
jgi:hypothetical protein